MNYQLPYFYDTEIEWAGGRKGTLRSAGLPDLLVAPPPEFQGESGVWTPEHLLVASVNSCFSVSVLAIAELSKLDLVSFASTARGKLEKVEGSGFEITGIVIEPSVTVRRFTDLERAARILEKAGNNCLISKSIKAVVTIEPKIRAEMAEMLAS